MMQSLILSRIAPSIGLWLMRMLPRKQAYSLAAFVARKMAKRQGNSLVQGARVNQAGIRGVDYRDPSLDEAVRDVYVNSALGFVDFFKAVGHGKEAVLAACEMAPKFKQALDEGVANERGLVVVGAHLVGFDFFLLFLGLRGYPVQALSYANPQGSYTAQNELRRRFGVDLTPISTKSLRRAFRELKEGRTVLTGVDRPGLGGEELIFFGRPTVLPVGHARLAVRTNSPILLGIPHINRPGHYRAEFGGLFEPRQDLPQDEAVRLLAQQVISGIEEYITRWPDQWLMFYPCWPELMEQAA